MEENKIDPIEATFVAIDMITSTMFKLHRKADIKLIRDYIFSIESIIGMPRAMKLYELITNIELVTV